MTTTDPINVNHEPCAPSPDCTPHRSGVATSSDSASVGKLDSEMQCISDEDNDSLLNERYLSKGSSAIDNYALGYTTLDMDDDDSEELGLQSDDEIGSSMVDASGTTDKVVEHIEEPRPLELQRDPSLAISQADLDIIQSVMSSINLPSPAWADAIPESKWLPVFSEKANDAGTTTSIPAKRETKKEM
ncbi:hypothetical protein BASA50_004426 [Batrachochytrium salamandrivorans]|uniref:Male-enhanced antigen 1 n=1 Tax=Batrachochytrium salamandrivorans TaxID=1357716 RepID=A0ABQ8FFR7_9FUNG|nr:hypothetical protein BASA62_005588 [Batrachochytrium salamandrivorans]KAH6584988.1 hypothetical protein BASA60_000728 [Batrachochytrium salamandrivorans]KAH6589429.1 hypothetical protein BASA61_005618 [Batrachochytrium salamandrivorans]KAH6597510.1 hypothetical protein BASA50_004426 [Batrachochytrium salamandrivorans]KAJ1345065.1 hypothetical protein BSLG_000580 [Batrachochytrium salamandrivorans]